MFRKKSVLLLVCMLLVGGAPVVACPASVHVYEVGDLHQFAGSYDAGGLNATVEFLRDGLHFAFGEVSYELISQDCDLFVLENGGGSWLSFVRHDCGHIAGFTFAHPIYGYISFARL